MSPNKEAGSMPFDLNTFMSQFEEGDDPKQSPAVRAPKRRYRKAPTKPYGRHNPSNVGGTTDLMKAIYMPADHEMCVVVPDWKGRKADGSVNRNP